MRKCIFNLRNIQAEDENNVWKHYLLTVKKISKFFFDIQNKKNTFAT